MIRGDGWLTVENAAAYGDVSVSTITRAMKSGTLRSVGAGRRRRTTAAWINEWLPTWAEGDDHHGGDDGDEH